MSYFIQDKSGTFLGDVASTGGMAELREAETTPEPLYNFIMDGGGDKELCAAVIESVKENKELQHWAEALAKAKSYPVEISDGT